MMLAAADWFEILAALIFLLVTGGAQFLQKRARTRQGLPPQDEPEILESPWTEVGPSPPREPQPPPRPRPDQDWEEALRRILGAPATPTPPPLPPPPRLAPQPNLGESISWETAPAPSQRLAPLPGAAAARQRADDAEVVVASRLTTAASLAAAATAYAQASNLQESVAARMRAALDRPGGSNAPLPGRSPARPPLAPATLNLFRHPAAVRQAVVAAVVLGPPKGLDPTSGGRPSRDAW